MNSLKNATRSSLHFLQRDELYRNEKPYAIEYYPHGDVPQSNIRVMAEEMPINDMRQIIPSLNIEKDGFVVRNLATKLTKADFSTPEKVVNVYLEEVKETLSQLFQTRNVAIIEYLVRRRNEHFPVWEGQEYDYAQPVSTAHIDFSPDCLVEIIRDRYAHRADSLLAHRYRIVNAWKPLQGPLQDWPLALCKPSSLDTSDLQLMDRVYATNIEETIQVHYNERQEWYYLSDQKDDELLIFKGGDSSIGLSAGVPHGAFQDPAMANVDVIPRESVEVRALVFDADETMDLERVTVSKRHGPNASD